MGNTTRFAVISISFTLAGFAEDSSTGGQMKSTTHYDLVQSLARCFGQTASDAQTIANYSQATDSGQLNGVTVTFTSRLLASTK